MPVLISRPTEQKLVRGWQKSLHKAEEMDCEVWFPGFHRGPTHQIYVQIVWLRGQFYSVWVWTYRSDELQPQSHWSSTVLAICWMASLWKLPFDSWDASMMAIGGELNVNGKLRVAFNINTGPFVLRLSIKLRQACVFIYIQLLRYSHLWPHFSV